MRMHKPPTPIFEDTEENEQSRASSKLSKLNMSAFDALPNSLEITRKIQMKLHNEIMRQSQTANTHVKLDRCGFMSETKSS